MKFPGLLGMHSVHRVSERGGIGAVQTGGVEFGRAAQRPPVKGQYRGQDAARLRMGSAARRTKRTSLNPSPGISSGPRSKIRYFIDL
jgi:hypothetical protein